VVVPKAGNPLVKLLAIRLGYRKIIAKSLVIRNKLRVELTLRG
jgi:hypothetical protein